MYEFIDVNERQQNNYFPSVAMNFNGRFLEEIIDGYNTLRVAGREVLSYDLDTIDNISGRDGGYIQEKTLQPRTLKITYELKGKDHLHFQQQFRWLQYYLTTKDDVEIYFKDDPDVYYYGQVIEMDTVPDDKNHIVSSFVIRCDNPLKFEKQTFVEGNPSEMFMLSPFETVPSEIEIKINETTDKIRVRNETTGRNIILDGDYKNNDVIKIRIKADKSKDKLTKNGQSIMKDLDYTTTDFNKFKVKNKDIVSVVPSSSNLKIKYRGVWK